MTWIFDLWDKIYSNLFIVPIMVFGAVIYTKFVVNHKIEVLCVKIDSEMKVNNSLLSNFKDVIEEYKEQNRQEHKLIVESLKDMNNDVKEINNYIRDKK